MMTPRMGMEVHCRLWAAHVIHGRTAIVSVILILISVLPIAGKETRTFEIQRDNKRELTIRSKGRDATISATTTGIRKGGDASVRMAPSNSSITMDGACWTSVRKRATDEGGRRHEHARPPPKLARKLAPEWFAMNERARRRGHDASGYRDVRKPGSNPSLQPRRNTGSLPQRDSLLRVSQYAG
jgi:hypothetical protein